MEGDMDIKDVTRRGLFKLSGGGVLAGLMGPAAIKNSATPLLKPLLDAGVNLGAECAPSTAEAASYNAKWKLFNKAKHRLTWENYRVGDKHGSFRDPDITALKSVSPAMKAWMQRERDLQANDWIGELRHKFGVA